MSRTQFWSWFIAALATACALSLTAWVGFDFGFRSAMPMAALLLSLIGMQACLYRMNCIPRVGNLFGVLSSMTWSLLMIGFIALAGLGVRANPVDSIFVNCDALMSLNAKSTVEWISHWPMLVGLLEFSYVTSVQIIFLTAVILSLLGQSENAWKLCVRVTGAGLACVVLGTLFPAIGAFATLGISTEASRRLPFNAGTFHLQAFYAYREGQERVVDAAHLQGVITFPSFHAIMAVAIAHAWSTIRFCILPAVIWSSMILVSTIPIGGHYFSDLIAGVVLYLLAAFATSNVYVLTFRRALFWRLIIASSFQDFKRCNLHHLYTSVARLKSRLAFHG